MCIIENVLNLSFTSLNWFSAVSNLLFRWWFLINQLCFFSICSSLISDCFFLILLALVSGLIVLWILLKKQIRHFLKLSISCSKSIWREKGFLKPFRWPFSQTCRSFRIQCLLCPNSRRLALSATSSPRKAVLWAFVNVSSMYLPSSSSEMGRGMKNWSPELSPQVSGHPYKGQWYVTDKTTPTNSTDSSLPCGRNKIKPGSIPQSIWGCH